MDGIQDVRETKPGSGALGSSKKRGNQYLVVEKITREEIEGSRSGFCWVASRCVIFSTHLLNYRIREVARGG